MIDIADSYIYQEKEADLKNDLVLCQLRRHQQRPGHFYFNKPQITALESPHD
jgi:hypothetical protein